MSLYKKHREQVKSDIVQLSLSLFREYGYENVTIEQITKKMEIAKGTFYNFFESKKDILMFWAAEQFNSVDINSAMNANLECEDNLRTILINYVNAISKEYNLFKSFLQELDNTQSKKVEAQEKFDFIKILTAVVINSKNGVKIANQNFELKMQVLNSAIFYELKSWILAGKDINNLSAHLIEVMKICLYGMNANED